MHISKVVGIAFVFAGIAGLISLLVLGVYDIPGLLSSVAIVILGVYIFRYQIRKARRDIIIAIENEREAEEMYNIVYTKPKVSLDEGNNNDPNRMC